MWMRRLRTTSWIVYVRETRIYELNLQLIQQGFAMAHALTLAAKAYAFLKEDRSRDVKSIGLDVEHRVAVTFEAEAEERTSESIVQTIFDELPVP